MTYTAGFTPSTRFLGCFFYFYTAGFLHAVSSGYGLSDPANHIVHLLPKRVLLDTSSSEFALPRRALNYYRLLSSATSLSRAFATCGHLQRPPRVFSSCSSTSCREQMILLIPCFHQSHRWADAFLRHPEYSTRTPNHQGGGGHSARDQLAKRVSSPRLELPLCSDPVHQSTAFAK